MRLESLTAQRAEIARRSSLESAGHFRLPVFPVLPQFVRCDPSPVLAALGRFKSETRRFSAPVTDTSYSYFNDYFTSPDAEVAYALLRQMAPKRLIEVGSGNSTKLFRQAIKDGGLSTDLVSIDPFPRAPIEAMADRVVKSRLEQLPASYIPEALSRGDILFIDSSHEVRVGNDVVNLLLNIVPKLEAGVLVHLHDIFLPYEYPRNWLIDQRWDWNEQYLVQAVLQGSDEFEVLWPGHFLQRTLSGFTDHFDFKSAGLASSLWLQKLV
jgi:Methyltransferase domain